MPGTRKLGRTTDSRKEMLRAMVTFLLENGQIETTLPRAKEVRCVAEKMITLGKTNTLHAKRQALAYITKEDIVKKLFAKLIRRSIVNTKIYRHFVLIQIFRNNLYSKFQNLVFRISIRSGRY